MIHTRKNNGCRALRAACVALCALGIATTAWGAAIPIEAKLKQILVERAYERGIENGAAEKPWASADMKAIGKISHPRLGKSDVILSAGTVEAMRAGPTLVPGSANIGEAGTSVIAAHRDTHFAYLQHVKVGDIMRAAASDGVMRDYRVTATQIVDADEFAIAEDSAGNRLALSTCYPFGSQRGGKMRYVVHAEQIEERKK